MDVRLPVFASMSVCVSTFSASVDNRPRFCLGFHIGVGFCALVEVFGCFLKLLKMSLLLNGLSTR